MKSTRTFQATAGLALAALAALGAGCGDDKGDEESGGVTKTEYLTQARTICQKGNKALTSASNDILAKLKPGEKLPEPEIEKFVKETVIPTVRDQVNQLRALPPPKGGKQQVEEIYGELEEGLDELDKNPGKLTDGSNVFADADALSKKYGIEICSVPTG